MKQVKREDLEVGKKYWIEAEFKLDHGGAKYPLYFDFVERCMWFSDGINIALLEEGEAEESPKRKKVILTEEQHELLESFEGNKEKAIYYIARVGHGHPFTKGNGDIYDWDNVAYEILANGLEFEELKRLLITAVVNGYEVKAEPLYWVRDKNGYAMLYKTPKGNITSTNYDVNYEDQLSKKERYTFTEKEIKDYDERYMGFAVPVEE